MKTNIYKKIFLIYLSLILFSLILTMFTNPEEWGGPNAEKQLEKYSFERFFNMMYFSSTTYSTVGYGDIHPVSKKSKLLVMIHHFVLIIEIIQLFL